MTARDPVEQQREHFNAISARYAQARRNPNHLLLKELLWSHFLGDKPWLAQECRRVLEPMCGMGEGHDVVTRHIRPDIEYSGFDYSENIIEEARAQRPGLRIERADATRYVAPAEPVDLVVLIGGLHHVFAQAREVVGRLATAIRPGGYFLNFEPTQDSVLTRRVRERIYRRNPLFDAETERGFDLPELRDMFLGQGLRQVDLIHAGLASYVLYYNPDAFPNLNVGGAVGVKALFGLDRMFFRNAIGAKFSFATMSLWQKR